MSQCAKLFGATVDARQELFEVSSLFVLQPNFDSQGTLIKLSVVPKYWFEESHPDWAEPPHMPVLSKSDSVDLLERLDSVIFRGKLIEPDIGSVVTNSTSYFLDKYENAYLSHGEYADWGARFLEIYPFHQVEGTLRKRRHYKSPYGREYYQVLVGELAYFVRGVDYRQLKLGRVLKVPVVGPVKGYCYPGHCNP